MPDSVTAEGGPIGFAGLTSGGFVDLFTVGPSSIQNRGAQKPPLIEQARVPTRRDTATFEGTVRDLRELLEQKQVATAVLLSDRGTSESIRRRVRAQANLWTVVVVLALASGLLMGLSVEIDNFPVQPAAAMAACLGCLVLMATLSSLARSLASDS